MVVQRLEDILCKYSLLDPMQSAYRNGHSTETAFVQYNNDIVSTLDGGECVILASLNLSLAFHIVDHAIFLLRLNQKVTNSLLYTVFAAPSKNGSTPISQISNQGFALMLVSLTHVISSVVLLRVRSLAHGYIQCM